MNSYMIALLVALPFLIGTVSAIDRCTTYTYCEDRYYCCRSNLYCCPYSNDGLSPRAIAGIVIGGLAGLFVLIILLSVCVQKLQQPRRRVATVPRPTTDTVSNVQQGNIPPPDYSAEQENIPPPDYSAQQENMPPLSNSAEHEMHHPHQPVYPPPPAQ